MEVAAVVYEVAAESVSACPAAAAEGFVVACTAFALEFVWVTEGFEDWRVKPDVLEGLLSDVSQLHRQVGAGGDVAVGVDSAVVHACDAAADPLAHI